MYAKMRLPDGSKWKLVSDKFEESDRGLESNGVEYPNGMGSNDCWEVYVSESGDLTAVISWFELYEYVGGTLHDRDGEVLSEFFLQDESAEDMFRLSRANMVKAMVSHLHDRCP